MSKTAFIFPGQGSQFVGMGRDFYNNSSSAKKVFELANDILGFDLIKILFDGPDTELNRTDISQPAILTVSMAVIEAIKENFDVKTLNPVCTAGLSLGEYSALAFAESITINDAIAIVRKRGEFMQKACDETQSSMASILGMDEDQVNDVCKKASSSGIVCISNINSPGQIVISGEINAVNKAVEIAKEEGARRVIPLKVAGAFHSPIMAPAESSLLSALENVEISPPQLPVFSNVNAEVHSSENIKMLLGKQLTQTVLWKKTIENMINLFNPDLFVEVAPNKVLTGLMRKISPETKCINVDKYQDLDLLNFKD